MTSPFGNYLTTVTGDRYFAIVLRWLPYGLLAVFVTGVCYVIARASWASIMGLL